MSRAPDEAARWFARALELVHDTQSQRPRRHLLSRLAHAQARGNDPAATATANAAAALALELGDVETAANDLCLLVRLFNPSAIGQPADEVKIQLIERALELASDEDHHLRGRLLARLAGELSFTSDLTRKAAIVVELRHLIDVVEDPVDRWGLLGSGNVAPGHSWADRANMEKIRRYSEAAAPKLTDSFERMEAQELIWDTSAALGDRDRCDQALEALALEPAATWSHLCWSACTAYLDGRLIDFDELNARFVESLRSVHHPEAFTAWYCNALLLKREQGTVAELQALMAARASGAPPAPNTPVLNTSQAYRHLLAGQHNAITLHGTMHPLEIPDDGARPTMLAWTAEIMAAAGDEPLVEAMLSLVEPFQGMHLVSQASYLGCYDRLTALLRDRLGDHKLADAAFARAIQATYAFRTPVWVARTELDWAESLLRRGLRDAAAVHVRAARAAIGDLPLTDSRNRADQLDARLT